MRPIGDRQFARKFPRAAATITIIVIRSDNIDHRYVLRRSRRASDSPAVRAQEYDGREASAGVRGGGLRALAEPRQDNSVLIDPVDLLDPLQCVICLLEPHLDSTAHTPPPAPRRATGASKAIGAKIGESLPGIKGAETLIGGTEPVTTMQVDDGRYLCRWREALPGDSVRPAGRIPRVYEYPGSGIARRHEDLGAAPGGRQLILNCLRRGAGLEHRNSENEQEKGDESFAATAILGGCHARAMV